MMRQHYNNTAMKELYKEWMKWSGWFFAVMVTIRVIRWVMDYFGYGTPDIEHFIFFINESTRILMLVIGIMMVYTFLRHYTELGLTRRTYFLAGTISSFLVTLTISVISFLLPVLERVVLSLFGYHYSEVIQAYSFGYWIHYFLFFVMTTWLLYTIGWFIGHVFYRYNWWIGLLGVGFSIIVMMIEGMVTGDTVTVFDVYLDGLSLPLLASSLILLLLSVGMLGLNYLLVKNIRVKMK